MRPTRDSWLPLRTKIASSESTADFGEARRFLEGAIVVVRATYWEARSDFTDDGASRKMLFRATSRHATGGAPCIATNTG